MGFFDNLWDGVKSAGQWALDHSADIIPVVKAVASVAGSLAVEDDYVPRHIHEAIQASAAEGICLDQYQKLFSYNNKQLIAAANNTAKAEQSTFIKAKAKGGATVGGSTTTVNDNVSGIWTMPVALVEGHVSASMYGDLSKFLGTMNVPTTCRAGDGTHDLVDLISSALFANFGSQTDSEDSSKNNPITSAGFSFDMGDGNSVHCGHSFYALPLGKGAADNSLHSAISVNYITTDANQARFLAERKEVSFHKPLNSGTSQWMITLNVTWASCLAAQGAQKSFMEKFAQNTNMSIATSQLNGILQLLKVTAPGSVTPAAVRAAVQAAAGAALATFVSAASGDKAQTEGALSPSIIVGVRVTDSSFLLAA